MWLLEAPKRPTGIGVKRARHSKKGWGQLLQLTTTKYKHGESLQEKHKLPTTDHGDGAEAEQRITLLTKM